MQRILGLLGSIAIGLVLTAVGLIYDAKSLLFAGIILLALVAVLWLWSWAHPREPHSALVIPAPLESGPAPGDSKERALHSLRRARDSAAIAKGQRGDEYAARAYHELEAAMLSIKREFGIGPLRLTAKTPGSLPYKDVLTAYLTFVDRIYPLLREGHVEEAAAKARGFKWTWAEED